MAAQRAATSIDELFKLKDRKGADMVLAMTHEEVVTTHVAQVVRSYRDLPLILYHFQTKERDEPRPRAGRAAHARVHHEGRLHLRPRRGGPRRALRAHREAYDRIFDRCGLEWYRVESDVGMMGGFGAHEYMAPCPAGENDVALAPGYAANVEVASAEPRSRSSCREPLDAPEEVQTPGPDDGRRGRRRARRCPPGALLKAYPVIVEDRGLVLVLVRGDHRVNDIKLANALGDAVPARRARTSSPSASARAGYIGPVGADVPILLDDAVAPGGGYVAGANRDGRAPARRRARPRLPVQARRRAHASRRATRVDGHPIRIEPAIEVGNIFKLGTRYSEPLGATYLDEDGNEQPIWMGSYGIGPARIAAAAVEQFADEQGISWPRALAPFDVHLVGLGKRGHRGARGSPSGSTSELRAAGLDVHLRRPRRRARARSSPTPSCSAARCG